MDFLDEIGLKAEAAEQLPEGCLLDPVLGMAVVMCEVRAGRSPCERCNMTECTVRGKPGGPAKNDGITNTTKFAEKNPAVFLAAAMKQGTEKTILSQEAAGQAELVTGDSLPVCWCGGRPDPESDKMLIEWGFTLGEPFADDELFRPATLPPGWKKKATNHSMHSCIVDDKGRERISIFYKAAFYDRRADMCFERRFSYKNDYDFLKQNDDKRARSVVTDCGEVVFTSTEIETEIDERGRYQTWDAHEKTAEECRDWLAKTWPDWEDCGAYWDSESASAFPTESPSGDDE